MEGIIQYDQGSENHYKWIKVKKNPGMNIKHFLRKNSV